MILLNLVIQGHQGHHCHQGHQGHHNYQGHQNLQKVQSNIFLADLLLKKILWHMQEGFTSLMMWKIVPQFETLEDVGFYGVKLLRPHSEPRWKPVVGRRASQGWVLAGWATSTPACRRGARMQPIHFIQSNTELYKILKSYCFLFSFFSLEHFFRRVSSGF